ncbi:protein of unknown function [Nitrospira japonica]|uniref:Uncharacterized protein n=1 Tax=Nitrospira japonica TaxID=1325564 RepID=A0A1W1I055_9BACT|nr:protein of unknown function [Nitrospira japonica]
MSGVPPTGNKGFGIVFVNGLSLVPNPAAKIIAFINACRPVNCTRSWTEAADSRPRRLRG